MKARKKKLSLQDLAPKDTTSLRNFLTKCKDLGASNIYSKDKDSLKQQRSKLCALRRFCGHSHSHVYFCRNQSH